MRDGFKASFSTPVPSMTGNVHAKPNVGIPGKDGGYYIPSITRTEDNDLQFEFLPSQEDMPPVDPVKVELPNSGGNVENGEDGFSPIAKVEQTAGGAVISITDKDGTTTATITNGKDGKDGADGAPGAKGDKGDKGDTGEPGQKGDKGDKGEQGEPGKDGVNGVTPHVGSNGNWFIGDNDTGIPATGPAGGQGLPGTPGEDGVDGYSPVRGKDYWTDADKLEIKSYVDEAILGGVW